ncbi:unnamed protein product, partial [Rotaria magnacalcarata]
HCTHGICSFSKHFVEQYQQTIIQQLYYVPWQPATDLNILFTAINELDSNDRHLITIFYDFQPNEQQMYIEKKVIWQTKEQEEISSKRNLLTMITK